MSVLQQRQKSMEAKFAREAELEFQARIRAFRFVATWATALTGEAPNGADGLVQRLIREDMRAPGDDGAVAVLREHLGELVDEALLRRKLEEFARDARAVVLYDKAG